jgi:hypothetical protein
MAKFNEVSPLRFWCQKVLPLVYDESLSYEELLCKIVNYLNNVVEDVNQIPEYIKSLVSEDVLKELLSELLDELRTQIVPVNEGTRTTASRDRFAGDLVWLNGNLVVIIRDILAGTEYIEQTSEVGVTGNYIYTSINRQMNITYNSDNKRLTVHGYVAGNSTIISRGDYHVYDGANQAIRIVEV